MVIATKKTSAQSRKLSAHSKKSSAQSMLFNYLLSWRPSVVKHRIEEVKKTRGALQDSSPHARASQTNAIREALQAIASQALEEDGSADQNAGEESETSHHDGDAAGDYLRLEAVQSTNPNAGEQNKPSCPNGDPARDEEVVRSPNQNLGENKWTGFGKEDRPNSNPGKEGGPHDPDEDMAGDDTHCPLVLRPELLVCLVKYARESKMDQPNADELSTSNDINMHVDQPNADKSSDPNGDVGSISTSQAVALRTCVFNDVNMDQREWTGFGADGEDQPNPNTDEDRGSSGPDEDVAGDDIHYPLILRPDLRAHLVERARKSKMGLSTCPSDDFNMDQWTRFGARDEGVPKNADVDQTKFDNDDAGDGQIADIDYYNRSSNDEGNEQDDASKHVGNVTDDALWETTPQ
ncbi:hypothetical protein EDB19DRAFT_1913012 [Suillus lakei]|nr:hypothetical protein EDB19DRAFT_1913012 [Suillus lakei]